MTEAKALWRKIIYLKHGFLVIFVLLLVIAANIWAVNIQPHQISGFGMTISKNVDKRVLVVGESVSVHLTIDSGYDSGGNVTMRDWFPVSLVLLSSYAEISSVSKGSAEVLTQLTWNVQIGPQQEQALTYTLMAVTPSGEQTLPNAQISWANKTATSREENKIEILEASPTDVVLTQAFGYLENIALNILVNILVMAFTFIGSYLLFGRRFRTGRRR